MNTGQLAVKMVKNGAKQTHIPIQIDINIQNGNEIKEITTGSLNSVALVGKIVTTKKLHTKYKE